MWTWCVALAACGAHGYMMVRWWPVHADIVVNVVRNGCLACCALRPHSPLTYYPLPSTNPPTVLHPWAPAHRPIPGQLILAVVWQLAIIDDWYYQYWHHGGRNDDSPFSILNR